MTDQTIRQALDLCHPARGIDDILAQAKLLELDKTDKRIMIALCLLECGNVSTIMPLRVFDAFDEAIRAYIKIHEQPKIKLVLQQLSR